MMLLLNGARHTGTFSEGYFYSEEELSLSTNEAKELQNFCEFIDNKIGGAGGANIEKLFLAFKNPTDFELQKFAKSTADLIKSYKNFG